MGTGVYVERRSWSPTEKRAIALEAFSDPSIGRRNVSKVARRHGIQTYQLYRWRDKYLNGLTPTSLVAVRIVPDTAVETSAEVPTVGSESWAEIVKPDGSIRIPLSAGVDFIAGLYVGLSRSGS